MIRMAFIVFLMGLFSGCPQQDMTRSDGGESYADVKQSPIIWGKKRKISIYLNPLDYADQDALGQLAFNKTTLSDMEFIIIPAGSFWMGTKLGQSDESPVHKVDIQGFKLSMNEVTQEQWRNVMGSNPSYFKNCDNCPVDSVSWNDVQDFIDKLNQISGKIFRLPTEAEWEYACRSGGKTEKYCGSNISPEGWYGLLKDTADGSPLIGKTKEVQGKGPNRLGLHDMNGNVWEWVQDCYHNSYYRAPSNGGAWVSGDCKNRVVRGGSWSDEVDAMRSHNRNWWVATKQYNTTGFRIAID